MSNHHIGIDLKLTSHGAGRLFLIFFLVAFGMTVTGCRSTGHTDTEDALAEKNRDRLRSICNAWYYNSDAPPVTEKIPNLARSPPGRLIVCWARRNWEPILGIAGVKTRKTNSPIIPINARTGDS